MKDGPDATEQIQEAITVGGLVDESQVSLGVYGDDLDPDELSERLGAQPTRAHRKGELHGRRSLPWKKGAWILTERGTAPVGPDELIHRLLDRLPDDAALWAELGARFKMRLGVGVFLEAWNRGFTLGPRTLERVARLGLELDFDIYWTVEDEP